MKAKDNSGCSSLFLNNPTSGKATESTDTHTRWFNTERMGKIYQVVLHGMRGEKKTIDLCNTAEQMKSMTVKQLKEKIAERFPETGGMSWVLYIFIFERNTAIGLKFTLYYDPVGIQTRQP